MDSKTKPAPSKAKNKALSLKDKVAEAYAKMSNKVTLKGKATEDKSRSAKISPGGDDPKRALKLNMGGNTIKTNGEGFILAQSPKPEGESLKRHIPKR